MDRPYTKSHSQHFPPSSFSIRPWDRPFNWLELGGKTCQDFYSIDKVSIWKYLGLSHFPGYVNGNCKNKSIYLVGRYLSFLLTANKGRLSEGILIFFNGRARYGTVKTSSGAIYCISSSWWTKTVAEVGSSEALIRIPNSREIVRYWLLVFQVSREFVVNAKKLENVSGFFANRPSSPDRLTRRSDRHDPLKHCHGLI